MTTKQKTSSTKTVTKTKTKRRKPETAPRFIAANIAIVLFVSAAAVASTVAAIATVSHFGLSQTAEWPLMAIAGTLAFLIALVPILSAPAWAMSRGNAKWIGLALIAMIMVPDAVLQTNAVREVDLALRTPQIAESTARIEALELAGAEAHIISRERIQLNRVRNSDLKLGWIGVMMALIQISTFFMRAWLTMVTRDRNAEIKADREAKRAPKHPAKPKAPELQETVHRFPEPGPRFEAAS